MFLDNNPIMIHFLRSQNVIDGAMEKCNFSFSKILRQICTNAIKTHLSFRINTHFIYHVRLLIFIKVRYDAIKNLLDITYGW